MALGRVAVAVLSLLTFLLALTVQGILKVLLIGLGLLLRTLSQRAYGH